MISACSPKDSVILSISNSSGTSTSGRPAALIFSPVSPTWQHKDHYYTVYEKRAHEDKQQLIMENKLCANYNKQTEHTLGITLGIKLVHWLVPCPPVKTGLSTEVEWKYSGRSVSAMDAIGVTGGLMVPVVSSESERCRVRMSITPGSAVSTWMERVRRIMPAMEPSLVRMTFDKRLFAVSLRLLLTVESCGLLLTFCSNKRSRYVRMSPSEEAAVPGTKY